MTPQEINSLEVAALRAWAKTIENVIRGYCRDLAANGATPDDIDQILAAQMPDICASVDQRAGQIRGIILSTRYGIETECKG